MAAMRSESWKPTAKQHQVIHAIRKQIVEGALEPGSRLPTRTELRKHFDVSAMTIQSALDRLREDGFVNAMGRQGTFVADRPPHLSRLAMITPNHPSDKRGWSTFWTSMVAEARDFLAERDIDFPMYYGIRYGLPASDQNDLAQLIDDIQAHRLGGLVFTYHPDMTVEGPLVIGNDLPKVAIALNLIPGIGGSVYPDVDSFIDKALDYVAQRNGRRVAVMSRAASPNNPELDRFREGIARRGMRTEPYWFQSVDVPNVEFATNAVHGMVRGSAEDRPDSLIILDDNLTLHATAGVVAAGLRVSDDIVVVGLGNFPNPTPSAVPIVRLGFDIHQVLQECVDSLEAQRRGMEPGRKLVEAVFEEDYLRGRKPRHTGTQGWI